MKNFSLILMLIIGHLFLFQFSCKKQTLSKGKEPIYESVTIPFRVLTVMGNNDSIYHQGTFGIYAFWDSLYNVQQQPTGFYGIIFFSDKTNFKQTLRFNPYLLQNLFELPANLERGLMPQILNNDTSIHKYQVTDNKISFETTRPGYWKNLWLYIVAKYHIRE